MTAPDSTVVTSTLAGILTGDLAIDLNAATPNAFRVALFSNAVTGFDIEAASSYGDSVWATGDEVSAAGYTAGGQGLTAPTLTNDGGDLMWAPGLAVVEWEADVSGVRCLLHYHAGTGRAVAVNNLGGDFAATAGVFALEYGAAGIMRLLRAT